VCAYLIFLRNRSRNSRCKIIFLEQFCPLVHEHAATIAVGCPEGPRLIIQSGINTVETRNKRRRNKFSYEIEKLNAVKYKSFTVY